ALDVDLVVLVPAQDHDLGASRLEVEAHVSLEGVLALEHDDAADLWLAELLAPAQPGAGDRRIGAAHRRAPQAPVDEGGAPRHLVAARPEAGGAVIEEDARVLRGAGQLVDAHLALGHGKPGS